MSDMKSPYSVPAPLETKSTSSNLTSGERAVRNAFANAEDVSEKPSCGTGSAAEPITPLGHNSGNYYFIAPSGQLRKFSAESLESGRGVKSLFAGTGILVEAWCLEHFSMQNNNWTPKAAGLWIIER